MSDCAQELLDVAEKLFAERGFKSTTVKDICSATGVNVSLVSYHFGGKEEIYRKVISRFGKMRYDEAVRLLKCERAPKDLDEFTYRLEIFFQEMYLRSSQLPQILRIIEREKMNGLPYAEEEFRKYFLPCFQELVSYLNMGKKAEFFSGQIDMRLVAHALLSSLNELIINRALFKKMLKMDLGSDRALKEALHQLLEHHLFGLKGRPLMH